MNNGADSKVPSPPSVEECALQLEIVAKNLEGKGSLAYIVGNRPVEHQRDLKAILLQYPDLSGLKLMGRLLADGRARLIQRYRLRDETKPFEFVYRRLDVYLGYSHNMAFWAWVEYQQGVVTDQDETLVGGAMDAAHLEALFTRCGDEPGRILNSLLKAVKNLPDGEAARKRQIAQDLDEHSHSLQEITEQLDKMLPPVEVDESDFDYAP